MPINQFNSFNATLTNEIEDEFQSFAMIVPRTTAVRGPAARRSLKCFLFP